MNILFCSHNGNLEGAPLSLFRVARGCADQGHACTLLLGADGLLTGRCHEEGLTCVVRDDSFLLDRAPVQLMPLLREHEPDLVVVNTLYGLRLIEACAAAELPSVWIIRESDERTRQPVPYAARHLRMPAAIVFPSAYVRGIYPDCPEERTHVIPNGVRLRRPATPRRRKTLRAMYGIPGDAFVFCSIGTFGTLKGHDILVEAALNHLKAYPASPLHLVLAGGVHTPEQQSFIDQLMKSAWIARLRDRFHVFADHPLPDDLYGLSDAYVCASRMESCPRTVLEAMAASLPVIATDTGGIPELWAADCGSLIPPENADALQEALEAMMASPEKNARGRAGWRNVKERFSVAVMQKRYGDLFASLAGRLTRPSTVGAVACRAVRGEDVTFIMRASRPETLREAARSAMALFPDYREFLVGASPTLDGQALAFLSAIPRVRIVTGTDERSRAGDLHYRLLDLAEGAWVVNVDDDDFWVYAPPLKDVQQRVGIIHGQYLYLNQYLPASSPMRVRLQEGKPVTAPTEVHGICGSQWIMRKEAWNDVTGVIDDHDFNYSDWRMYYHVVRLGWEASYVPRVLGVARRESYNFPNAPGSRWKDVLEKLERAYGATSA